MKNEWFGTVRWNEDDLANALELHDYPATEENIAKLREMCDNHWFTDYMIESGWSYNYCADNGNVELEIVRRDLDAIGFTNDELKWLGHDWITE